MFHLYPTIKNGIENDEYCVKVNGKQAQLNFARVSAYPFNRRWPGHQRDINQSEITSFLSLETDERLDFEITVKTPFEKVEIRPKRLNITPRIDGNKIYFSLEKPAYFTVEPFGRSRALHIFADPLSDYGTKKTDEHVIYFGKGEHDVGMITLKSGDTLFIDEGAVVYACVSATDAENIKILGRGILDNSRNREEIFYEADAENNHTAVDNAKRIHTVQLNYCNHIEIDGITIRDSLVYNIRPIACENIRIKNVKIIGCWRYNSDGIDMHNCKNVLIDTCFLRTFDDSICIKGFDPYGDDEGMERGGKLYNVFKNTVVKNCVIWNDWGKALEIGAETQAEEISDIHFMDCDIIHITASALDCCNVDYADVHTISYENIAVEFDENIPCPVIQKKDAETYINTNPDFAPPLIDVSVIYHFEYSAPGERRGKNHDILYKNIFVYGRQTPKISICGYNETYHSQDITIKDIYINGKKSKPKDLEIHVDDFAKNIRIE